MSRSGSLAQCLKIFWDCLNPSFSGCPALGCAINAQIKNPGKVLIPLLVDVPLWDTGLILKNVICLGLNPSFSGCPALGLLKLKKTYNKLCLNPSFSGCPALG